jgi:iron-sulfur cluster repair protein YtfE (RIC family)
MHMFSHQNVILPNVLPEINHNIYGAICNINHEHIRYGKKLLLEAKSIKRQN